VAAVLALPIIWFHGLAVLVALVPMFKPLGRGVAAEGLAANA
jgi:hypothetical protein